MSEETDICANCVFYYEFDPVLHGVSAGIGKCCNEESDHCDHVIYRDHKDCGKIGR